MSVSSSAISAAALIGGADNRSPSPKPLSADLVSEGDFAAEFRVSLRTLSRWRSERTGPPYVKIGIHVFYRRSSFEAFLARREQGGPEKTRRRRRSA